MKYAKFVNELKYLIGKKTSNETDIEQKALFIFSTSQKEMIR